MKGNRSDHAHGDAQDERKYRRAKLKMNQIAELNQHHKKREQHNIHHAPLSNMFHDMQSGGFVPLVQKFQQTEFQQQYDLCQREDNRKQQHNTSDQPVAVFQQLNRSAKNAGLLSETKFFNLKDRTKDRRPE